MEALAQTVGASNAAARAELATNWFHEELAAMEREVAGGVALERQFVVLGNPSVEQQAAALLQPHLRVAAGKAAAPEKKKSGLFGWFSRK